MYAWSREVDKDACSLLVEEVDSTGQVVVEESEVKTYVEYLGRLPCKG